MSFGEWLSGFRSGTWLEDPDCNPFIEGTREFKDWNAGWQYGKETYENSLPKQATSVKAPTG